MIVLISFTILLATSLVQGETINSTLSHVNVSSTDDTSNNSTSESSITTTLSPNRSAQGLRPLGSSLMNMNTLIVHLIKQQHRAQLDNSSSCDETSTIDPRASQCFDGQTFWNGTACQACTRQCPSGAYMTRRCLQASDMQCQCHKGAYLTTDAQCKTCSECPSGWGVWRTCRWSRNTVCRKCQPGTYSGALVGTLGCIPCTKCAPNQEMLAECDGDRDTVCLDRNALLADHLAGQDEEPDMEERQQRTRLLPPSPSSSSSGAHPYDNYDNTIDRARLNAARNHYRRLYHFHKDGNTARQSIRGTSPEAISLNNHNYATKLGISTLLILAFCIVIFGLAYFRSRIGKPLDPFGDDDDHHHHHSQSHHHSYQQSMSKMMAPPGTATRIMTQSCFLGGCQQRQTGTLLSCNKVSPLIYPLLPSALGSGIVIPPPQKASEPVMHSLYQKASLIQPVASSSVASSISANELKNDASFRRHQSLTKSYYALLYPPSSTPEGGNKTQVNIITTPTTTTGGACNAGSMEKKKRSLNHEMRQMLENRLGNDEKSWRLLATELGYGSKQIDEIEMKCSTLDRNQTMIDAYKAIRLLLNDWCHRHWSKERQQQSHETCASSPTTRPLVNRSSSQVSTLVRALIRIHRGDCARLLTELTKSSH